MTDMRHYEITKLEFATLLGLEHQHNMETQIHSGMILKKEEMLFKYALGAKATPPPKI
jgi:hypothetical protein